MDSTRVMKAFAEHLVANGLVRLASVAGPQSAPVGTGGGSTGISAGGGGVPPVHVEPNNQLGVAPGERPSPENDDTLVVTMRHSTQLGERPPDTYRKRFVIDMVYRSRTGAGVGTGPLKRARALDAAISDLISGAARGDYGYGWTMGTSNSVLVLECAPYSGLTPLSRDDSEGAIDIAKYIFEVQRS